MSEEQKKREELEGTFLNKGHSKPEEFEIESLIKETLEESRKLGMAAKEEKPAIEAPFKATPISKPQEAPRKESEIPAKEKSPSYKEKSPGYDETFKTYKAGDIVKGKVVKVDPSGVLVDIGYKAEAMIPPEEISDKTFTNINDVIKVGEDVKVLIERLEDKEGYVVVSKKRAEYESKWREAYNAYKERRVLEATVTGAVKGGLVVDFGGIRGFIPASQVAKAADDKLEAFVGQTIPIKILEIDRRQGKVVLSHKLAAGEKQKFQSEKVLDDLEVGQVKHGTVSSIKNFGAFVDLGGIEGLIHITEMSWKRVNHPSDMLKVGDELDVFILGVDKVDKKVALGLKELQPDPWVEANDLYKPGQLVKGKVARLVKFGAFIELEGGLEGLCHISELSAKPIQRPEEAVKAGDQVTVKILRIIPEEQKIGLSVKEAVLEEERAKTKTEEQEKAKVTIEDVLKEKSKN